MHEELKRRTERLLRESGRERLELGAVPPADTSIRSIAAWHGEVGKATEYMTLIDLDLRILYVNRLQAGLTDVVGSSVLDWIASPYHDTFLQVLSFGYLTGLPGYYDVWGAGPNGETVGYRSWVVPLPGPDGGVQQFVGISVDISHVGRVERELAEQSSVLDSIARDAPDHIMILDREHCVQFVNHLLPEFQRAGVVGKTAETFVSESERARVRKAHEFVFSSGEATSYETSIDLETGRRWYSTRAGPIMRDGRVERVLLISSDVTSQKTRELASAHEKNALDALERVNRRIVPENDLDSMIEAVLEELFHIFAATRVCLCGPRPADVAGFLVSHEHKQEDATAWFGLWLPNGSAFHAHLSSALATEGAQSFTGADAAAQKGSQAPPSVGCALSVALHPRKEAPWVLSIHFDQPGHDQKHERLLLETLAARMADGLKSLLAQRALRQSEERFRTLVEHAPEAIIILDMDTGCFVEANANAEQLFGMSREVLLDSGFVDLCPERQPDGQLSATVIGAALGASLAGKTPTFELQHRDTQGRLLFCEVRLVRLPHNERRLVRGSISDISARKRAEEDNRALAAQLAQAQKMQAIGQLTGGIAHDFNNLLTVIIGSLALMDLEGTDISAVREFARQADAAAQRAASLTQRLLAFSRRQPLRPQSVDLRGLFSGMEHLLRRTLHESIALEVSVISETWSCEADPVQLESAILNLAINARDAMPRGGHLQIFAQNAPMIGGGELDQVGLAQGDYVRILVRDTGTGMGPEVLAQAFEPFFTTKDVGEGSGLGLSMVYGFIKQSGGHVQIRSELGKGTEIALHLPRGKRSASSPTLPAQSVQPAGEGRLILVVEDDAGVRQLVCEMLSRLGYRTLAAEDARQALRILPERADIALMLTDMALPGGMSGADLVASVRAQRPDLPMLFMTGYSNDAIVNDQRRTHGVRLLPKPFSRASLASAVLDTLTDKED
jgi:PAS domain S-box-containing protein